MNDLTTYDAAVRLYFAFIDVKESYQEPLKDYIKSNPPGIVRLAAEHECIVAERLAAVVAERDAAAAELCLWQTFDGDESIEGYSEIAKRYADNFHRIKAERDAGIAERDAAIAERDRMRNALKTAEAALADIGDAAREEGDDLAWCESRAAKALPEVRAALNLVQKA